MEPWWKHAVVYQIYPRSFADSTGDGVGDLVGIRSKVPYLAETLGVDAIWLSPFYPSPQADFGYDVADYCDVNPEYGTLEDFDELISACNEAGLRVIVDLVPNHSSDQHEWFIDSRSSKGSEKRDWYVWADPAPEGGPPNNWLSVFGGPAWTYDSPTGQFYLHSFLREQPDLNWRNPDVREAMADVLRFWLERGVSGFRLDVAHRIAKDPEMRDDLVVEGSLDQLGKDMADYGTLDHVHSIGHEDAHGYFKEIRAVLDEYGDTYSVGEIHEGDWDKWAAWHGDGDQLHQVFDFSLLYAPWTPDGIGDLLDAQETAVGDRFWPNHVMGNHDEPRLATRRGPEAARAAAVLLLTTRGTPTLYYGDELGMVDAEIPPERQLDPWAHGAPVAGRDGCRTPMQWDGSDHAGFSPAGTESTWLPLADGFESRCVDEQLGDPDSMLMLYRDLLALRKAEPALHGGDYRRMAAPAGVLAFERGGRFLVLVSFGEEPVDVPVPESTVAIATDRSLDGSGVAGAITLQGNQAVVLRLK